MLPAVRTACRRTYRPLSLLHLTRTTHILSNTTPAHILYPRIARDRFSRTSLTFQREADRVTLVVLYILELFVVGASATRRVCSPAVFAVPVLLLSYRFALPGGPRHAAPLPRGRGGACRRWRR